MGKKVVGGQAVIEGVMMRCENKVATAVRKNGKIKLKRERMVALGERYPVLKIPLIRGFANLIEMLVVGVRTLEYSAQEAAGESEQISKTALAVTVAAAIGIGILLFVLFPYFLTYVFGLKEQSRPILFNLVDGVVKLAVLVAYIAAIGMMKDIRVLFQYHGAEHKAVACYEHGKQLDVRNCQKFSTAHARCGTSFLLFVILIGVLLFSFVPLILFSIFPGIASMKFLPKYSILFAARLLILPIIAGVAYELLKLSARFENNKLFMLILWPGLAVQRLTTREPNNRQVEVAIAALRAVVPDKS